MKQHTDCEVLVAQDKGVALIGDKNKAPALSADENYGGSSGLLPGTMQASGLHGQAPGKMPIYHQGGAAVLPSPAVHPGVISTVVKAGSVQYAYNVFWPEKTQNPKASFVEIAALKHSDNPLANPRVPLHGLIARATHEANYMKSLSTMCH